MTKQEKLEWLQKNRLTEWLDTKRIVKGILSDAQEIKCVCGHLATGLHEMNCRKFQTKVTNEAIKRMTHLIPKA